MTETTTSSPGFNRDARVCAAKFSASDAFLVKTISSALAAPMKDATLARAPSNAAVASAPKVCMARATLALCSR
jgi:hypothetical protein